MPHDVEGLVGMGMAQGAGEGQGGRHGGDDASRKAPGVTPPPSRLRPGTARCAAPLVRAAPVASGVGGAQRHENRFGVCPCFMPLTACSFARPQTNLLSFPSPPPPPPPPGVLWKKGGGPGRTKAHPTPDAHRLCRSSRSRPDAAATPHSSRRSCVPYRHGCCQRRAPATNPGTVRCESVLCRIGRDRAQTGCEISEHAPHLGGSGVCIESNAGHVSLFIEILWIAV